MTSSIEMTCLQSDEKSTAGRHRDQPRNGFIVMAAGGVAIVGGLVWHFLEPTGPKPATGFRRLTPTIAPGFGGLSYGGTF